MRAVHFVRSRQEQRELAWWLSFVAYDLRDRSLNNRIYLVYLVVFFGIWIFVTLTLFAAGGAFILYLINPDNPGGAAVLLMTAILSVWMVYGVWHSQRLSPVVFSEQDGYLICQTPVNRCEVTLRWLSMPWLKGAVPFWLLAITLGFSIAEATLAGSMTAGRLIEYSGFGIRAWMIVLPLQLGLYSLQWTAGISRLRVRGERGWLAWVVIPVSVVLFGSITVIAFASAMTIPAQVAFSAYASNFFRGTSPEFLQTIWGWLPFWLFAFASLVWMVLASKEFNLSQAAEETREAELISSAYQYGFAGYAEQLKSEQRLRGAHSPARLPTPAGAGMLVWKDALQSLRSLRAGAMLRWVWLLALSAAYPLLPDPGSRALAALFWMIQIGRSAVIRLRSDLSRWALIRQLAIPAWGFVLFELAPAYGLSVLVSLAGLVLSGIFFSHWIDPFALLIPGMAASAAGMAAFDILRRSHSDLLMAGSAPGVSAGGMVLALIVGGVPWLIATFIQGWLGVTAAVLISLGLGYMAVGLAVYAFRKIDGG